MKKVINSCLLVLLLSTSSFALAASCDRIVDQANVLDSSVQKGIDSLDNVGADPHFVTANDLEGAANLDTFERNLERSCPSWQGQAGNRKNNLVVVIASPKLHKVGIYYGSRWHEALYQNDLAAQNVMKPQFRDGDFSGGFNTGAYRVASYIENASKVTSSSTTVVNEAPTDYSGLWKLLKWLLFTLVVGGLAAGLLLYLNRKKKATEAKKQAQSIARSQKVAAINAVNNLDVSIAQDDPQRDLFHAALDALTSSSKYDVEADLSEADYKYIGECYQRISNQISAYTYKTPSPNPPSTPSSGSASESIPSPDPLPPSPGEPLTKGHTHLTPHTTYVHNTYIDNSSTGYVDPLPVFIPEAIVRPNPLYQDEDFNANQSDTDSVAVSDVMKEF